MTFRFLKANNGDSILISFIDETKTIRNILIDGGTGETFASKKNKGELFHAIQELKDKKQLIDLLILTHIDDDHIGGILKWFEYDPDAANIIGKVWFNSGGLISEYLKEPPNKDLEITLDIFDTKDTSISQGKKFEDYIVEKKIWEKRIIKDQEKIPEFGVTFKILSPNNAKLEKLLKNWKKEFPDTDTSGDGNDYSISLKEHIKNDEFKEDNAYPNGSSIAFILTNQNDDNFLFLGDSHPSVIQESLASFKYAKENPLVAKFVKVSHHGSKGNTSIELLEMVDSNNYIISTNGVKHNHPDKKCLARIINQKKDINLYFNYPEQIKKIFTPDDFEEFKNFKTYELTSFPS